MIKRFMRWLGDLIEPPPTLEDVKRMSEDLVTFQVSAIVYDRHCANCKRGLPADKVLTRRTNTPGPGRQQYSTEVGEEEICPYCGADPSSGVQPTTGRHDFLQYQFCDEGPCLQCEEALESPIHAIVFQTTAGPVMACARCGHAVHSRECATCRGLTLQGSTHHLGAKHHCLTGVSLLDIEPKPIWKTDPVTEEPYLENPAPLGAMRFMEIAAQEANVLCTICGHMKHGPVCHSAFYCVCNPFRKHKEAPK